MLYVGFSLAYVFLYLRSVRVFCLRSFFSYLLTPLSVSIPLFLTPTFPCLFPLQQYSVLHIITISFHINITIVFQYVVVVFRRMSFGTLIVENLRCVPFIFVLCSLSQEL